MGCSNPHPHCQVSYTAIASVPTLLKEINAP